MEELAGIDMPKEFGETLKVSLARARIEPQVRDMLNQPKVNLLRELFIIDGLNALQSCAPPDDRPQDLKAWIGSSIEAAAARQ